MLRLINSLNLNHVQTVIMLLLLFSQTLQQKIPSEETPLVENVTMQKTILELLVQDIVNETSEEICVHRLFYAVEICFPKTFPTASNTTSNFIRACLNVNTTILGRLLEVGSNLETLDECIFSTCVSSLTTKLSPVSYTQFIRFLVTFYQHRFLRLHFMPLAKLSMSKLLSVVRDNNSSFTVVDHDYILKAWQPFATNISGIVTYKNLTYLDLKGELITYEEDIIDVMFYIPSDFLDKLTENLSHAERMRMRIMVFVFKDPRTTLLHGIEPSEMLGVDFPNVCINNELTMIKIWYREHGTQLKRKEYNQNNFDPIGCATLTCTFHKMSFLGLRYDTIDTDICPSRTTTHHNWTLKWTATPRRYNAYPVKFCMRRDCTIPFNNCFFQQSYTYEYDHSEKCYEDNYISNNTQQLYQNFRCCQYNAQYCKTDFNIDFVKSYSDVRLLTDAIYTNTLRTLNQSLYLVNFDLMEKGLEFLMKEKRGNDYYWPCIASLLINAGFDMFICEAQLKRKNYIITTFCVGKNTSEIGFALYRSINHANFMDYQIKALTRQNASNDYSTDSTVELVMYVTSDSLNLLPENIQIDYTAIIIRNDHATVEFSCRSPIVVVYQRQQPLKYIIEEHELAVYIQITGSNFRTEGYWFTVNATTLYSSVMFCVSELGDNVCNIQKQLTTYTYMLLVPENKQTEIKKRATKPLDMLSQITISINPSTKQMFQDYYHIFHIISLIESAFSILGLFCILISALILRGWWEIKFNTIQLSITLFLEVVFFLVDLDNVTQIGYLIFYYCILAQFSWMSIIGYLQYLKFVKVFASSSLNKKTSLIIGWLTPGLIILFPAVIYSDCLKCNLCYKNYQILNYFVIAPISLVVVINLVIYLVVMYNISRIENIETSNEIRRAKYRAAILFPFLLGVSRIFIFALMSPWSWLSLVGSFIFYVVTPLQGFVLFIFAVVLDSNTRTQLRATFTNFVGKISRNRRDSRVKDRQQK